MSILLQRLHLHGLYISKIYHKKKLIYFSRNPKILDVYVSENKLGEMKVVKIKGKKK